MYKFTCQVDGTIYFKWKACNPGAIVKKQCTRERNEKVRLRFPPEVAAEPCACRKLEILFCFYKTFRVMQIP